MSTTTPDLSSPPSQRDSILSTLRILLPEILPISPGVEVTQVPFLDLGANSLTLMEVQRAIEKHFSVTVAINQFFEDLTTLEAVASYLDQHLFQQETEFLEKTRFLSASAPQETEFLQETRFLSASEGTELEQIFAHQLQAASNAISQVVSQQLAFLHTSGLVLQPSAPPVAVAPKTTATTVKVEKTEKVTPPASAPPASSPSSATSPQYLLTPLEIRARGLTPKQQQHLEALIERYTKRTKTSKQLTQKYRSVLADSRASVGFRFTTKEMLYPITGHRAQGSRVWDVDGNEYIDITMGQGVNLFGHNPPFLLQALAEVMRESPQPGPPRSPLVGEVAQLITEFTKLDRVTFTNSGTEAVMTALRMARSATGRQKIVIFENSYHGHSDSTMVKPMWEKGVLRTAPVTRSVPQGMVEDMIVLEYGSDQALDYIRKHATELAAVLVEPVQSRHPSLQPKEFLQQLRQITKSAGALLMFDEMITGFRLHPGGAQAWFGVPADIATYGKILAGGLPIGIVAGKAEYMDTIDGGMWDYGDNSYPTVERIGFGGTFCQHPLAMATTLATLKHLKAHSPTLQENLNCLTTRLATELNTYFDQEEVPIAIEHFGSQFRFKYAGNQELLFYHMMEKGVFIWEWRNYFLSTAHTEAEIDRVIEVVKECVEELREGEFFPPKREEKTVLVTQTAPLSEAQKQLWALAQIMPAGSQAYHLYLTVQLEGTLSVPVLRQALQRVVERHEALRTVIRTEGQDIWSSSSVELSVVNFSATANQAVQHWFAQDTQTPFDLTQPLFRAYLLKVAEQRHLLVLTAHHLISDGMSLDIVLQETAKFYSGLCQGTPVTLPPPLQYREYVQWQTEHSPTHPHASYWLNKFAGTLPVLDLPTDHPYPPLRSYQGRRQSLRLDPHVCSQVKQLSQQQGCTYFMTFLAVYALFLHRLTHQDQVVVGIPTLGRSLKRSTQLVGYCTHLLPIQSVLPDGSQTFLTYLKTLRGVLLEAYQHQDYPFAYLINQLKLRRDGSHSPLVATVFNLDRPVEAPRLHGLQVTWQPRSIQYTAFDLTFNLTEMGQDLFLECDYNIDVLEDSTIARWLGHFQTLLAGIVTQPQQAVSQLPLLTEAQRHQILVAWNNTRADYPRDQCFQHLFATQVEKTPEAIAVVFEDQQLTYAQLNQKANQLAHYLQTLGILPDTLVGICFERSINMLVAILATLKAGGAYLPLDPSYPPTRLAFMLEDAKVPVLLTQSHLLNHLPSHLAQVLCLDTQWDTVSSQPTTNPHSATTPTNLAYVIYTSGSTGKPKGTMIVHQGLINYLSWAVKAYDVANGAGSLVYSTIGFDATITSIFAPLLAGRPVVLLPEKEQEIEVVSTTLVSHLQAQRNWSLAKVTPAHLEILNALLPKEPLQPCRYLILGGEALTCKSVSFWRTYAPKTHLINEYGPTETVVGCCVYEVNDQTPQEGTVAIGRPIANTQLYILDANLQPVPIGVPGELYIGGDGLARGYLNRPDLTAEKFIRNPFIPNSTNRLYKTGDLARYLPNGNLEYLGRIDNQVKIRGFRVELGEIETLLLTHPQVKESVVSVHRLSSQDLRLVAYLVMNNQTPVTDTELRHFLFDKLPEYMVPTVFIRLETFPLTPNGKVDRKALPLPEGVRPQLEAEFVSPKNHSEQQIAQIWQDLLKLKRVGIYDNFFELGGHSLLIIPLRDKLQQTFNREISPVDLFKYPTVHTLAQFLTQSPLDSLPGVQGTALTPQQLASRQKQAFLKQQARRKN